MSLNNQYVGKWADGTYTFALNLAEIEELQRLCGTEKDALGNIKPDAFGKIFNRVLSGEFFIKDVYETIRLGLIGGKLIQPHRAKELVDMYVVGRPVMSFDDPDNPYAVACAVLNASMSGIAPPKDANTEEGKSEEGEKTPTDS